jgi:tRNA(adenine34) deaminase
MTTTIQPPGLLDTAPPASQIAQLNRALKQGRSSDWISERLNGIAARHALTEALKQAVAYVDQAGHKSSFLDQKLGKGQTPEGQFIEAETSYIYGILGISKEARKALKTGDIPVGAVAVLDGKIIARAHNEKEKRGDSTAHAELLCLQKTAKKLKTWRLTEVDLYTTLEPCPMCAGAMVLARIKTLIYGASDPKAGAAGSVMNILRSKKLNHRVKIISHIEQKICGELLKDFFKYLRSPSNNPKLLCPRHKQAIKLNTKERTRI